MASSLKTPLTPNPQPGVQASTAKRTARAKSDARLTRGGEETEDLGDAWSEREMKLPKVVEPLRFKKVCQLGVELRENI